MFSVWLLPKSSICWYDWRASSFGCHFVFLPFQCSFCVWAISYSFFSQFLFLKVKLFLYQKSCEIMVLELSSVFQLGDVPQFSKSSLDFNFQVGDTSQKRKKGILGAKGGDKEVKIIALNYSFFYPDIFVFFFIFNFKWILFKLLWNCCTLPFKVL